MVPSGPKGEAVSASSGLHDAVFFEWPLVSTDQLQPSLAGHGTLLILCAGML